jgi:hypothetical protein
MLRRKREGWAAAIDGVKAVDDDSRRIADDVRELRRQVLYMLRLRCKMASHMTILDPKFKVLRAKNVNRAPRKRGVYALYKDRTLVYLGKAMGDTDTIRSQLRSHLESPPKGATRYKREPTKEPGARLEALLKEHVATHRKPPIGNVGS